MARGACIAGEQRARCRRDIGLPHQAFADQEGRHADAFEPRKIRGRKNAALADHQAISGDQRRQRLAGRKRGLEGAQIAVVDADHRRTKFQRAIELGAVVDFDQHVHAVRDRGVLDVLCRAVVERRHDDQDAVGAVGAGFRHLIGVEHEILAQHRQIGRRARRHHEIEMALERRRVRQHGEARRAAGLIGFCQRRRIEIGADQTLGGRRLLDLGDQRIVAAGELVLDRAHKAARRRRGLRQRFDARERMRALGRGDLLALVGLDLGQDIGHRFASQAVGNRDQLFQLRRRRAAVERFGADGDAFLQILGAAGDDQRRRGIQQRDVAIGARLALEHAPAAPPHWHRRRRPSARRRRRGAGRLLPASLQNCGYCRSRALRPRSGR